MMSLLQQWNLSTKLVIRAVQRIEKEDSGVLPLPWQQEEGMTAMKTLFEYLMGIGASVQAFQMQEEVFASSRRRLKSRPTHHTETSTDEALVVCYCVSIICPSPTVFQGRVSSRYLD